MADRGVPLTYVIFDLLSVEAVNAMDEPFRMRRQRLDGLGLNGAAWTTAPVFEDAAALWRAVCERGLEGLVAKRLTSRYRPAQRGWVKVKNPAYWRRGAEMEAPGKAPPPLARRRRCC
jgi:bifunctional non-homologous end joining protein LigD